MARVVLCVTRVDWMRPLAGGERDVTAQWVVDLSPVSNRQQFVNCQHPTVAE